MFAPSFTVTLLDNSMSLYTITVLDVLVAASIADCNVSQYIPSTEAIFSTIALISNIAFVLPYGYTTLYCSGTSLTVPVKASVKPVITPS